MSQGQTKLNVVVFDEKKFIITLTMSDNTLNCAICVSLYYRRSHATDNTNVFSTSTLACLLKLLLVWAMSNNITRWHSVDKKNNKKYYRNGIKTKQQ